MPWLVGMGDEEVVEHWIRGLWLTEKLFSLALAIFIPFPHHWSAET